MVSFEVINNDDSIDLELDSKQPLKTKLTIYEKYKNYLNKVTKYKYQLLVFCVLFPIIVTNLCLGFNSKDCVLVTNNVNIDFSVKKYFRISGGLLLWLLFNYILTIDILNDDGGAPIGSACILAIIRIVTILVQIAMVVFIILGIMALTYAINNVGTCNLAILTFVVFDITLKFIIMLFVFKHG